MFKSLDKFIFGLMLFCLTGTVGYLLLKKNKANSLQPALIAKFVYDTDQKNNFYIQGSMSMSQMTLFDSILEYEKTQGGAELSWNDLAKIAQNDLALIEAYRRWRDCKDMMRSHHRIVYPSERKNYIIK
jgi:hypothetical protein